MKTFWDYCRFVFISPELLVGLCVGAIALVRPQIMIFFSQFTQSKDGSVVVALIGVPIILTVAAYNVGKPLLDDAAENGIVKWVGYGGLKHRVYFSWLLCAADVPVSYGAWYSVHQNRLLLGTAILLAGWAVCAVSIATLGLARISLREIIAKQD